MVNVVMERDDEPRTVEVPADFARALRANRTAQAAWDKASYTHRKEY
ncbi:MAG: Bacteriocin-protection, YdeI or OmpD-Associated, partial [Blastocatellia bacterium]